MVEAPKQVADTTVSSHITPDEGKTQPDVPATVKVSPPSVDKPKLKGDVKGPDDPSYNPGWPSTPTVGPSGTQQGTVTFTYEENTSVQLGNVYLVDGFYFGFNKTTVYSGETRKLDDLYKLLRKRTHLKVQIQAYTDCRGKATVNKRVAMQRAASYKKYLEKKGIAGNRIVCKWFGTREPKMVCSPCNSCSEDQHRENRRIEFKILQL